MKRPFLAQLVCIVRGVVILLSAARPVRAGNNMEVQLCLMSTRMLLPTAAPRRWRGRYPLSSTTPTITIRGIGFAFQELVPSANSPR
jgi:hypothetical protein